MASITFYVPDQEPVEVALDELEQLTIGRGPDNDIVLDHVSLSGSHAVIRNLGGAFQVNDLDSTNGTFLNGQPVSEGELSHGSQVTFGNVEAVFADEAAVAEAGGDAEAPAAGASAGAASAYGSHHADLAEVSNKPSGYVNLSPVEKVEKKSAIGQVAMILGIVALLGAGALVGLSFTMSAG